MCDDTSDRTVSIAPGSAAVVSMSVPDVRARIAAELRQDHMRRLVFRCGQTVADFTQYGRVACAVASDRIHVVVGRDDIPGSACYSPYWLRHDDDPYMANTLYLRTRYTFDSIREVGLVVHEATHAIQDLDAYRDMSRRDAECAAYTAQSFYCFVRGTTLQAVMEENRRAGGGSVAGGDALIAAADAAAGRMFRDPAHAIVTEEEMTALRNAVEGISIYHRNFADILQFDGV